ncbi:MAG: hypothetical protein JWM27_1931 [Gemmatimonadetes bacterium]|nr:hypothetical protein [Gemmatimonadota bacterium]
MRIHPLLRRHLALVAGAAAFAVVPLAAQTAVPTGASLPAGASGPSPTPASLADGGAAAEFDYRAADSVALTSPEAAATSVETLARDLTRGLHTDREKIRAIYRWVTQNIAYDVEGMHSIARVMNQDPGTVLQRRRTLCDGYSFLVGSLARMAGMEAEFVEGKAKGLGVDDGEMGGNHSWVAVKVDGEWRLIDATWGAGDIIDGRFVRRFRDFFFLVPPEKLIWTHFPRDPRWQLLEAPVTAAQFRAQPMPQRDFFELGFDAAAVRATAASRRFHGFVGVFPVAEHRIRLVDGPLAKDLSPDSSYAVALDAPGATEATIVSAGAWIPMPRTGDRFAARFTPAPGSGPVVMVRYPGDAQPRVILAYAPVPTPEEARRSR